MEKEFAPYEEALALKELKFDEPCFGRFYTKPKSKMFGIDEKGRHYQIKNTPKKLYTVGEYFVLNDNIVIIAPTFSQAFRWFRENHFLNYKIFRDGGYWICVVNSFKDEDYSSPEDKANTYGLGVFNTYPEAELACLKKLIEIVKNF
jgi:hypothetical protein